VQLDSTERGFRKPPTSLSKVISAMRKYSSIIRIRIALGILLAGGILMAVPASVRAQCAPYSAFQAMTTAQLQTLQVKISHAGPSRGLMPSLVFTAIGNTVNTSLFSPCELTGVIDPAPQTLFVSTAELQAIITNVGTLPAVTGGGTAANPFLEFSMANTQPSQTVFAAIIDSTTAASLFTQLRASLTSKPAMLALSKVACSFSLLEPGKPTDVTSGFTVTLSGVRLKRSTGGYVGNLTVANNSGSTPAAPVSVALSLPTNVTIANADGLTCATMPPGLGYINLTTIPASGSNVMVPIEFDNPDLETLSIVSDKVYAGPGAR
jgi:hypothetical protein